MLKIHRFVVNPFEENTYVLVDEATREAAVVDAGMWNDAEREAFDGFVKRSGIKLNQAINTHMHIDHCFGISHVKNRYGVKLGASADDSFLGSSLGEQARRFGLGGFLEGVVADVSLSDGDIITIGESQLEVIAVPGHSPGGIAFYCKADGFVLTGDSLFDGAIGRTDLPGGDYDTLVRSIRKRLLELPASTDVFPGHGNPTTIARERTRFFY